MYSSIGMRKCSIWSSWRMNHGRYSAECSLDSVGKRPKRRYSSTRTRRRARGPSRSPRRAAGRGLSPSRSKRSTNAWWLTPAVSKVISRLGHADELGQQLVGVLDRVAEPDHAVMGAGLIERPHEHRHRVGVVEQPGLGADLVDVAGDLEHHRDRPQRAEHPADAERVADRLAQAVTLGDLEVTHGRVVTADLDLVDHEVGALERRAPLEVGLEREVRPGDAVDVVGDPRRGLQPAGIDVVQGDGEVGELRVGREVGEQHPRELDTSRSDERDLGHARYCSTSAGFAQDRAQRSSQ